MKLVIELPPREEVLRKDRLRWAQVIADRTLADLPFKVETNRDGVLLMAPPPSGDHSDRQSRVLLRLNQELESYEVRCAHGARMLVSDHRERQFNSERKLEMGCGPCPR